MDEHNVSVKTIGLWISEKKSQKFNWKKFLFICKSHGYSLIKVDLERPFEEQGNFDVFLHKLTDIIAAADQGDCKSTTIIQRVEQYFSNHPNVTVIDPLDNVRILLNRYKYYTILKEEQSFYERGIFTPSFAEFITNDEEINIEIIRQRGITFPVICKPTIAHGSKSAHQMVVIFNQKDLSVCKAPCVVQSFVNHNAVLHKVFLVGNRYYICKRPSLKNFYASDDLEPIFYSTGEVCKADSHSTLSILDPLDNNIRTNLDEEKIRHVIKVLRKEIGLLLAGFDVVIDNVTGNHAVIDINVFPSYDNFPNFLEHLTDCISDIVSKKEIEKCDSSSKCDKFWEDDLLRHKLNGLINVSMCKETSIPNMNVI